MRTDPAKHDPPSVDGALESEIGLTGLGVSGGIGVGVIHRIDRNYDRAPRRFIPGEERAEETRRLNAAVSAACDRLTELRRAAGDLPAAAAAEMQVLIDAHLQMLAGSRLVRVAQTSIEKQGVNAEAAIADTADNLAAAFEAMDDSYLAARGDDVRDVARRVIVALSGDRTQTGADDLPDNAILIAEDISPADAALLDPTRIAGLGAELGGAEGHTAIMARALGLPAVFNAPGLIDAATDGKPAIVDGERGLVLVNPTEESLIRHRAERDALRQSARRLERLRTLPPVTRDGSRISLQANLDLPLELDGIRAAGAEGIGLLRTEFQFMNRDDLPSEDEQYEMLSAIVSGMEGRPVVARTLDIGGDKLVAALGDHLGSGPNPALGVRAIRLSLKVPSLLDAQLAAMLRAGAHGDLRILLPMVSTVEEIVAVRQAMKAVAERLRDKGVAISDPLPLLGAMIEIPGAALSADVLAREADFFSIGTNDLTMYTLAIDRADDRVATLYDPLNPAVLRLIQFTVQAALRARIPIGVCGEMAADPTFTPLLLGLGVPELSMTASALDRVKAQVRKMDLHAASRRAQAIMDQSDSAHIRTLLEDFNTLLGDDR